MRRSATLFVLLLVGMIGFSACSGGAGEGTTGGVRTIEIKALDSLRFDPAELTVTAGEPIHVVLTNEGSNPHEFVLGDEAVQMQHEDEMESDGSMQHGMDMDLPALTLAPGETKEATVTFDDAGTILYGCGSTSPRLARERFLGPPDPPVPGSQSPKQDGAHEEAVLAGQQGVHDPEHITAKGDQPRPSVPVSDLPIREKLRDRQQPAPPPGHLALLWLLAGAPYREAMTTVLGDAVMPEGGRSTSP